MAKLRFSLVAPERELYAGEVDQVDAPGTEGDFGVLFGHEPFMTTLRSGEVVVRDGSARRIFTIQGGFADVTPESFTILAESASEATAH
jgi:F-type H+-transporting ATPase subunit epsilon